MKNLKSLYILSLIIGLFSITACNDDDVMVPEEEEVITTLTLVLTPDAGGDAVTMTWRDIDGDGGNDPVITGGTLAANATYSGTITLSNESVEPAEDITAEVEEENLEHQLFFSTDGLDLTFSYADVNAENTPVGLSTAVTTGDPGSGNLTITLRHLLDKDAAGVADGDITNAGGSTDIEVTFPVEIQ